MYRRREERCELLYGLEAKVALPLGWPTEAESVHSYYILQERMFDPTGSLTEAASNPNAWR
jgi:hypothetical protein